MFESAIKKSSLGSKPKTTELLGYLVVLAGSLASQYSENSNYASEIEVWTSLLPYILQIAEVNAVSTSEIEQHWHIIFAAIGTAGLALHNEVKTIERFTDFDPMFEVFEKKFSSRTAALLTIGLLADLFIKDLTKPEVEERLNLIEKAILNSKIVGEISIAYLFIACLGLTHFDRFDFALESVKIILKSIIESNRNDLPGLASPYYDLEDIILEALGEETETNFRDDNFQKSSFTIRALIFFLVCQNQRDFLVSYWKEITHFKCEEFQYVLKTDFYSWKNSFGTNWSKMFKTPQSWSELQIESTNLSKGNDMPDGIKSSLGKLLTCLYARPHRLNSQISCFGNYLASQKN